MKKIYTVFTGLLVLFLLNHNSSFAQYCSATSSCSIPIQNVTLNGVNNNISNASACSAGGYADYTAMKADIRTGSAYNMSVVTTSGGTLSASIYVYIDWNQNLIFENSEQVYTGGVYSPVGSFTSTVVINVPTTALLGETRMRIRTTGTASVGANISCGNQGSGEAEDYTVEILPANPPNCATNFTPASGTEDVCLNTTLSWRSSATGSRASGFKVYLGTATNPPLVSDQTDSSYNATNLLPNTTYYWKIVPYNSTGDATGCGENTFVTTDLSAAITPDPAEVCQNADLPVDGGPTGGVAPYSHTWSGSGSSSLSATNVQSPTFNSSASGTFDLIYQVEDANGCIWEETRSVTVYATDLYDVSIDVTSGNDTICAGETVVFSGTVNNGGANVVYDWQINGGSVGSNLTYSSSSLADQDVITLTITPDLSCPEAPSKTSNAITMKVNPILTPEVSVNLNAGANPTCDGETVEFSAVPTNGGTNPTYTWQVNGIQVGTGDQYASNGFVDQDEVTVTMTNNALCPSEPTTTSTPIIVTVIANETVSVSASMTAGSNPSCDGSTLEFTATPTNGGANPSYGWQVNGISTASGPVFTSSSLNDQDNISVVLTSDYVCTITPTATSNTLIIDRTPNVVTDLQIDFQQGTSSICEGETVIFSLSSSNGGTTPVYEWQVNGIFAANGTTYTTDTLADGDMVQCFMTSSAPCPDQSSTPSQIITMSVTPIPNPSVSIALTQGDNPSCPNETLEFTASPTDEGSSPIYEWRINGIASGSGAVFSFNNFSDQDVVVVEMTSNATCVANPNVMSNSITISQTPFSTTSVQASITQGNNPSCTGETLEFTATPTNGGTSPSYDWQINGVSVGTGSTYTSSSLNDQDEIKVNMASSLQCPVDSAISSSPIVVSILPTDVTSVQIQLTQGTTTICSGDTVAFALSSNGGGSTPVYEWLLNGIVATTGSTYTTDSLVDGDQVQVRMTSSAPCPDQASTLSNTLTFQVTPLSNPAVSIAQTGGSNPSCPGENLQFTATPTDGGTNPNYTWRINGNPIASGQVFNFNGFNDQDLVDVRMVSNAACAISPTQFSNSITINVTPTAVTGVQIAISQGTNPACEGSAIEFSATPTNGGANPSYQWMVNGVAVGSGNPYATSSLNTGDVVRVKMMSNAACADSVQKHSNSITMNMQPYVTPDISIDFTQGANPSCDGSNLEFGATFSNAGNNPSIEWWVNNTYVANGLIYGSSNLQDQDEVRAVVLSNATCSTSATDSSNILIIQRTPNDTSSIAIAVSDSSYCEGTAIDFLITDQQNEGNSPMYTWYVNGDSAAVGMSFTPDSLSTGDLVFVQLHSSLTCVINDSVASNVYTVNNIPAVEPEVNLQISQGQLESCEGSFVGFIAQPTNGGTLPNYSWYRNGVFVSNGSSYGSSNFMNGDEVYATMVSNETCVVYSTAHSDTLQLIRNPITQPEITTQLTSGSLTICEGENVSFKASASQAGMSPSFQWYWNGQPTSADSIYASSSFSDQDSVWCILTSSDGCAASTTDSSELYVLTVQSTAPAPIISTEMTDGNTENCKGDLVAFKASSVQSGSNPTYLWYLNGIAVVQDSVYGSSNFNNGDQIWCVVTSNAQCIGVEEDTSVVYSLVMNPIPPTPSVTQNGTTLTSSSSSGNQWLKDGVDIPGATSQTYTYTTNGVYAVRVIAACPSDTSNEINGNDVGLGELNFLQAKVFPNPTNGELTIVLKETVQGVMHLYDAKGNVLMKQAINENETKVSLTSFSAGLYRLVLETDKGFFTQNVVKY